MSGAAPKEGGKTAVGILGATGSVGQRFVQLLADHPWFEVTHLGASPSSAGRKYADVGKWRLPTELDARIAEIVVTTCDPAHFSGCDVVFSGLDSSVAGEVEDAFADAGKAVFSNARNHRMDPLVPLMVPTVNPGHMRLVDAQRRARSGDPGKGGFIVANANCSTTGLVVPLAALHRKFGVSRCFVVTMQAISGAGYPGLSATDVTDNVLPHISGEEDKLETEPLKILGDLPADGGDAIRFVDGMALSAMCNRVHVIDGHMESVSVELATDADADSVSECLRAYGNPLAEYNLPSAPASCLRLHASADRPQPKLDRDLGGGYTVSVGPVRPCAILKHKFTVLSHNTIIGAAGSGLLNAEIARAMKYI